MTLEAGYSKPVAVISMKDKEELIDVLLRHHSLYRSKAVLDQFQEGLGVSGVRYAVHNHGKLLKSLFVTGLLPLLSAGKNVIITRDYTL